jgi:SAM-dependent methyltransferase
MVSEFQAPRRAKLKQKIRDIKYAVFPSTNHLSESGISGVTSYNRILDDDARNLYLPVIEMMFREIPQLMSRKIPEANIQQAFVLDSVQKFASKNKKSKLLSVGCYEDSAVICLEKMGYKIKGVDPALNYDLSTYIEKSPKQKGTFDIVFSTSVIEHVANDELFISEIYDMLVPGGVGILTCDYQDQYKSGDPLPAEDYRFYTQDDFTLRLLPLLEGVELVGTPDWDCPNPDFSYADCHYTFATLVFRKPDHARMTNRRFG